MISLKHISSTETFNQTKFSADSTDSSYFLGNNSEQTLSGTPDVKYNDICFCKGNDTFYTHAHLYKTNTTINVDSELNELSENPVQNKVIANALNRKAEFTAVTQAEYNALSANDKANGTYLIKE